MIRQYFVELSQICGKFKAFNTTIRHFSNTFNQQCLFLYDNLAECGYNFSRSLKTNYNRDYKLIYHRLRDNNPYVIFDEYISPDQQKDLNSICSGSVMKCLNFYTNISECKGYFRYKLYHNSKNQFYETPFKLFWCNFSAPTNSASNLECFLVIKVVFGIYFWTKNLKIIN